jgi:hypothetical protein
MFTPSEERPEDFKWYEIKVNIGQDSHPNAYAVLIEAVYDAIDTVMFDHPEFEGSDIWSEGGPNDHTTEAAFSRALDKIKALEEENADLKLRMVNVKWVHG